MLVGLLVALLHVLFLELGSKFVPGVISGFTLARALVLVFGILVLNPGLATCLASGLVKPRFPQLLCRNYSPSTRAAHAVLRAEPSGPATSCSTAG